MNEEMKNEEMSRRISGERQHPFGCRDDGAAGPGSSLDPESDDPGYWNRFHVRTTRLATPELARRRRSRGMTVSEVVSSWSRTLVPLTMAAAAAALAVLYGDARRAAPPEAPPAGVERLVEELDGTPPPSILGGSSDTDIGTVAAEGL